MDANQEQIKDKTDEREARLAKLKKIRENGIDPYPPSSSKTHTIDEALAQENGTVVIIAGRILAKRSFGKLTFCKLQDYSGNIQIAFKADALEKGSYDMFAENIDIGDMIEVTGERMVTKTGEQSILASRWGILSKALLPLPDKFHGLQDKELRFRKRYLDLITNRDVFELFKKRSKIITLVREFLNSAGFMEVETPILQVLYGGTNARPFRTKINAYDMDMYLRVAPELYLKRLLVGGYEKLYELGRNFRNEGVDQTHNPEFTMIEWYEAYTDYIGMMNRAESLYKYIAEHLFGKKELVIGEKIIRFDHEWPRIKMVDAIKTHLDFDIEKMTDSEMQEFCAKHAIPIRGKNTRGQMIMEIFDRLVTPKLIDPTWIIDYPREVSPLSREHRNDSRYVERFECYIMGKEIGDGWSEIIDPQMQRDRFENEQKSMKNGDEEAHPMDEDFLEALEYGMPPTGGIGIGIDRLVMLFTNNWSIREIMFFPIMKPESGDD